MSNPIFLPWHWAAMDLFRQMFPLVNLVSNKVVTEEDGIYTSGGAYSFLNLMLHLVEKYCGRGVAVYISKFFEIEFGRDNQNQSCLRGQLESWHCLCSGNLKNTVTVHS